MPFEIDGRFYTTSVIFDKHDDPDRTFHALLRAEEWLSQNGYIHGPLCRPSPYVGLAKRETCEYIAKWYNLTAEDKDSLDGVMVSEDYRHGAVAIYLK